ncbi:bifunctional 3-oxoadipate enol-lactonase/4-carboxymuconolactone decarboxylase PcaDC [Subtercola boreus]|uniref:4-carboxymuconolactone decarboxylase n=1 Tax=Subtercola boreus TaxID=120213 RepID=A0A3E0WBD2_9MICO|nr:4-carboxymuconolactone decarboxylase [Subtercola boreus]RFA19617.1 4-carboxymuconolactone decarboxylase [Subtercola boreus]RFA25983.1 4-carboxymuconolactone decarboxylase [Subtercola boreus]
MTVPSLRCSVQPVASGAPNAELIVLGPSLGTTTSLWQPALAALSATHRVLRFDLPGHGDSPAADRPFTVAELAEAVLRLVDAVGGGAFHYAGVSMGGAIGLQLAVDQPERLRSLSVICSGAKIGTTDGWDDRATAARTSGTASLIGASAERWFAPGFLQRDPALSSRALTELLDVDDESYALCCGALGAFDLRDRLAGLTLPSLCVAGEADVATPPDGIRSLAASIDAAFVLVPGVGHLPTLEAPGAVSAALLTLLSAVAPWEPAPPPAPTAAPTGATAPPGAAAPTPPPTWLPTATVAELYDAGLTVRREVLGDAHVDAATRRITPETDDFQTFITRYAWGSIWTRPGLDRRSRSLLTLACLVTGGHEAELRMHVRAALTNGLSRAEISEALLHTAIYAGVPAANSAMGIARDVFSE